MLRYVWKYELQRQSRWNSIIKKISFLALVLLVEQQVATKTIGWTLESWDVELDEKYGLFVENTTRYYKDNFEMMLKIMHIFDSQHG